MLGSQYYTFLGHKRSKESKSHHKGANGEDKSKNGYGHLFQHLRGKIPIRKENSK